MNTWAKDHLYSLGHKGKCLGLVDTGGLSEDPTELELGLLKRSTAWLCLVTPKGYNGSESRNEEKEEKHCKKERPAAS